ncbi:MAG TPA: serine/threonine-protein kinase, partial [Isosphaeraceae bacterium]|nr:serine/threonine-protein kinase [Isosphaeraceae bacterium]
RLVERLGSGGMSSVLRALHEQTGLEVAVKVLPRYLAKNPTLLHRFLREAKSAESLEHPNIVAIYDRGFDQGRYYLVLEYVPGGDLHDRVRRDGPLPLDVAVGVIRSAAEGLEYAAAQGLIHRDIKPANLLVTNDGKLKITDLGLALQVSDDDERVTRDGTTVGTVDYMSPEQARDSRATSIRSDIYSLGCTFYYLLTGTPPFPGGDIVEKLKRHYQAPPPDPRQARPEVSEKLAFLVQRMMAKRADDRFADYAQLVAALDALPKAGAAAQGEPLLALIDDEETAAAAPLYALFDDEEGEKKPQAEGPLFAVIDDEDDQAPAQAKSGWGSGAGKSAFELSDLKNAELAPLDEEEAADEDLPWPTQAAPAAARRGKEPAQVSPAPWKHSRTVPAEFQVFDESAEVAATALPIQSQTSLRPWITAGVVAGVGFALLIVVSSWIRSSSSADVAPPETQAEAEKDEAEPVAPAAIGPKVEPRVAEAKAKQPNLPAESGLPVIAADTLPKNAAEATYAPDLEARFMPAWASTPIPQKIEGPFVTLRRVVDTPDQNHVTALWRAFASIGGTIEIADDGPFFNADFRIVGKHRLIRAKPGFRPVVRIERPIQESLKAQPAVFVLDGSQLVLDGIDLVVDAEELTVNQTALFLCRGASLVLNNCTVTVLNGPKRPFALVQTEEPSPTLTTAAPTNPKAPSQVRIERTLVRASSLTGFELVSGVAEVVVSRSVFACGGGPFVQVETSARTEASAARKVHVVRSLVACVGPVFRLEGTAPSRSTGVPEFRALGSTFARLKGGENNPALVEIGGEGANAPREVLDWLGFDNTYSGWPVWLAAGSPRAAVVANLAAAKSVWPGSDERSSESAAVQAAPAKLTWGSVASLRTLAPERLATLTRVAAPRPYLHEKSVGSFERLEVPAPPRREGPDPGVLQLAFDLQAAPWNGDLGLFLRDRIPPDAKRVQVRAHGSGTREMTPWRLPDGVSLAVEAGEGGAPGQEPITWVARAGSKGEALLETRGGDLALTGVRVWLGRNADLKHLLSVQRGNLSLFNCWLQGSGLTKPGEGALVSFLPGAASAALPTPENRPLCRLLDCMIITGAEAFSAELERGVVQLSNCAIASASDAIVLNPVAGSPERFEADLWLDHCTIAAERSFVRLAGWAGKTSGPDRPWLVSSQACAFLAAFAGKGKESVLLRADSESLAQGALFWQSSGDALEMTNFTASTSGSKVPNARPDVRQQWIDVWGANHIANVTGPSASNPRPSVRLAGSVLRMGQIKTGDLALDPAYHPGRSFLDLGADLRRLPICASPNQPRGYTPPRSAPGSTGTPL